MIQEREVRAKIAAVLRNEITVVDFARWIMANSWNMHQDSSDVAIDLVSDIHLLLAERDDFSINDEAFRRELLAIVPNSSVVSVRFDENFNAEIQPRFVFSQSWLFASPHPRADRVVLLQPT